MDSPDSKSPQAQAISQSEVDHLLAQVGGAESSAAASDLSGQNRQPEARGRASVRTLCQWGLSPRDVAGTLHEVESNCVAARRGGEQLEANG